VGGALSNHYLLAWPSVAKKPEVIWIQIENITELDGGLWVEFTYLEGPERDGKGGAPYCNILTEKEADLVQKKASYVHDLREEAKRLNREAKHIREQALTSLEDKEREI